MKPFLLPPFFCARETLFFAVALCVGCGSLDHGSHPHDASAPDQALPDDSALEAQSIDASEPDDVVATDAYESSTGCPEHATRQYDMCVCDSPYVFNSDCSLCVEVSSSDACPTHMYLRDGTCHCKAGFSDVLTCDCEAKGVGSPCTIDDDCFPDGVCINQMAYFGWVAPKPTLTDYGATLPDGYCSVRLCNSSTTASNDCDIWGGVCVIVQADDTNYGELCLAPCDLTEQCRDNYTCRKLTLEDLPNEQTSFHASPDQRYCLPISP